MDRSTSTSTWFITGSNRGMGLEMAIQLLSCSTNVVIATARNPSRATSLNALRLQNKTRLHIVQLDVSDEDSIQKCASSVDEILGERGLDYLVNNAGLMAMNDSPLTFSSRDALDIFRVNVLGPALVLRAFLPSLEKGRRKVVINISGRFGCVSKAAELYGPHMAMFSASKATLNMLTVKTACERPDLIVLALSPGHNSTDSGGEDAPHDPEDSVAELLPFISSVTAEHSGRHWDYWGQKVEEYPW